MRRRGILCMPVLLLVTIILVIFDPSSAMAEPAVLPPPEADVALTGFQQEGSSRDAILLSDQLRYRLTVVNVGATALPAGAVVLVASAGPLGPGSSGGFVVTSINSVDFDISGGACQVGAADVARCVNVAEIPPGGQVGLTIAYRHNQAVGGELAMFASVAPNRSAFIDPDASNDTFVGPAYTFDSSLPTLEEPVPEESVPEESVPDTTTEVTVAPEVADTTVDPELTTTTAAPIETTAGPAEETTTVATVADATTTLPAPAETFALSDDEPSPAAPAAAAAPEPVPEGQDTEPSVEISNGGAFIWLLGIGLLALTAALGGGLFVYDRYYREDAPLEDIRQYR